MTAVTVEWELAGVAVGVAAALVCAPRLYRAVRYLPTVVHELGHALACLAVGGRVARVDLRFDTSGTTSWRLPPRSGRPGQARFRSALITGAGYPAPPLAGAGMVWLVAAGHVSAVLAGVAAAVAIAGVLWVRNAWGLVVCAAVVAATFVLAVEVPDEPAAILTLGLGALLTFGGLRDAASLFRHGHSRRASAHSDAAQLQDLLWVRWWLWSALFTAGAAACAALVVLRVLALRPPPGG